MASTDVRDIPLFYRIFFLWFEPVAAGNGAFMAAITTNDYFKVMSPRWTDIAATPQFQVVFDQLAATYLLFALIEAVVLRVTRELNVWKAVLGSIICCDLIHIYATHKALGADAAFNPNLWRWDDWLNIVLLYLSILVRVAFVLGVGFPQSPKAKTT